MTMIRESDLTAVNDYSPQHTVGTTIVDPSTGYKYRYMRVASGAANAGSAGRVFYHTNTRWEVDDNYDVATVNRPAGIALGTITKAYYGWFLIEGDYAAVLKKTGLISAGAWIVGSSTDGMVIISSSTAACVKTAIGICKTAPATAGVATVSAFIKI